MTNDPIDLSKTDEFAIEEARAAHQREIARQVLPCPGCGGPNDHYPDCLPASQGGTMPNVGVM